MIRSAISLITSKFKILTGNNLRKYYPLRFGKRNEICFSMTNRQKWLNWVTLQPVKKIIIMIISIINGLTTLIWMVNFVIQCKCITQIAVEYYVEAIRIHVLQIIGRRLTCNRVNFQTKKNVWKLQHSQTGI